ncbi:MAG: hypothetical protein PHI31_09855 [Desulfuromonadaceae bacterium]|nr:hypothetical protein [Desulfuromonadaceae bacterium]
MEWLRNNKINAALIVLLLIAIGSTVWNWYHPKETVSQTQYQALPKEKIVERIKTVKVPGPKEIVTIEKQVIVEKLKLPESVASDPNTVITANAEVPPSEGGTSVVTAFNTATGETTIIAKEKPLSLFGFPSNVETGVRYGLTSDGPQQGDIYARWQFLRVGKVYVGTYGEITTQPRARAMLEASFRF